ERLTRLADDREELGMAADLCSDWLLTYLDRAQTLVEEDYTHERERWLRNSTASRAATIEAILGGRQADELLASQRLRHDLRLNHVALVAWPDSAAQEDALPWLEAALAQLIERAEEDAMLVSPLGVWAQSAWISRRRPFERGELAALGFDGERGSDV